MHNPRNNAAKTRGRPFLPGNSGRPKGARHRATLAAEALLDGEAEALTRKAVETALAGDTTAMRLCLERLVPPRKDRPIILEIGALDGPASAVRAVERAIEAMARGEITPGETTAVAGVLEAYRRLHETTEIEARLAALEVRREGS